MPKEHLVRIVKAKNGFITVDITGKEPGRGAYVCRASNCWDQVLERKVLERAFKQNISANDLRPVRAYLQEKVIPQDT